MNHPYRIENNFDTVMKATRYWTVQRLARAMRLGTGMLIVIAGAMILIEQFRAAL